MMKNIPIGQILLNRGNITDTQLGRALEFQKNTKEWLGNILVELGYVTEQTMLEAMSEWMNAPLIDILEYHVNPEAAALLPQPVAEKYNVLPIDFKNETLVVATNDALNFYVFDEIKIITEMEVSIVLAKGEAIAARIRSVYMEDAQASGQMPDPGGMQGGGGMQGAGQMLGGLQSGGPMHLSSRLNRTWARRGEGGSGPTDSDRTPVVQLVNTLLNQAHEKGASDIHIEPSEKNLTVRYRINGDLIAHVHLNMEVHSAMVTRLKIMGGMNIAEKRLPQDGKCRIKWRGMAVDLRISTLPTIFGEKLGIRLLGGNQRDRLLSIENLGMTNGQRQQFEQMLKASSGIILVSGPTGSGKTSTLYAALSTLVKKKINILTIEDPVEKVIEGISQVQVNVKAGLDFARAMRSFLRQDPDVIMVGEMRDSETATIGVRAAITGHLVLATIHTNDCASIVTRLIDMGVPPYMVAASLSGLVAQRLVKRLCPHCKVKYTPSATEKALLGKAEVGCLWEPFGCEHCNYTGYLDRTAIYEMIRVDTDFGELITKGASIHQLRTHAAAKGVRFLGECVVELALSGVTSMEEVEKIIFSMEQ